MLNVRYISERDIAIAVVLELAESGRREFSLLGFYDDDIDFLDSLRSRLNAMDNKSFYAKVKRVVRKLVRYDVLYSSMRGTQKYYIGEPAKQMNYGFMNPGKYLLLTRGKTDYTESPEWEACFLLRHAYPRPELV